MSRIVRVFAVVGCVLAAAPALAEKRVALVIGNSAYKHAPALANPRNDAEGMAAALRRLKFEVLAGTDLDKPAMEKLLQAFAQKLDTADVALVFYAGHGLQVHGRNYLVPVDGKLDRESDLPFQAVPLDLVQGLMEQGQRTNIMILDACRDNPLARNLARTMGTRSAGIGRGLGEAKAGIGTLIVYATQPGNVALDGDDGKNSPFTASLLKHMEAPGLEIRQVLTRVRNEVITATRDKQVPWDSSSLRGDFYFAAARETPATPGPAPATPPTPSAPGADGEIVFWQSIKDSKNAADFRAYIEKYPQGTFAALAKIRLAEIEKAAVVAPPAPAAPEKPAPPAVSPAPPKRTSTFVAGEAIIRTGLLAKKHDVSGGPACQSLCLANAQCAAWTWNHVTFPRECRLWRSGDNWVERYAQAISGVIRTTPTAASARPVGPKPTAPMASPIAEIRRKALAREKEGGFCATVPWDSIGGFATFIDQPRGATRTEKVVSECSVHQIVAVGVARGDASMRIQPGSRCIKTVLWRCTETVCGQYNPTYCKTDHPSFSSGCKCE